MNEKSTNSGLLNAAMIVRGFVDSLLKFSIGISAIALVLTYVLGMGEWTFNNMRVIDMSKITLRASVLISIVYSVVFRPISLVALNITSQNEMLDRVFKYESEDDSDVLVSQMEALYKSRMNGAYCWIVLVHIITGLIGYILRDKLMEIMGNPLTDILLLIIIIYIPRIISNIILKNATNSIEERISSL